MHLRPYQEKSVQSVSSKWREFNRLLGVAPTGSGKTIKFAHIAKERSQTGPVLILAHRDELLDHAEQKILQAVGITTTKEKAEFRANLCDRVVVASVQTLSRAERLQRHPSA
jgi:superfamily II DNA or RNA helicase